MVAALPALRDRAVVARRHIYLSPYGYNVRMLSFGDIEVQPVRPIRTTGELGAAIRGRRIDLGWSQARLAAAATVSRPWLSELEKGKRSAQVGLVLAVLDALDLSIRLDEAEAPRSAVLDDLIGGWDRGE